MNPQEQFCPNMSCPARGKTGKKNIVVHSRKPERYKCKECGKTFSSKVGTPFYRLHHSIDLVTCVITLIAYGCPVQAIVAAFRIDERTVMDWQRRSGEHAQRVHEHLVQCPRDLIHIQADEIRVKAQRKVLWLAMAIMVSTRLWLGAVVNEHRGEGLIRELVGLIRASALARPLLICVDGLRSYVTAVQAIFRSPLPARKKGRPRLVAWPDIHIGRVIKQYQGRRVVGVVRKMAQGSEKAAQALLANSLGGTKLNTAYIERLNATFRSRLASLARRSRALLKNPETLTPLVYLMGSVYNFCSEHKSLRLKLWVGSRGYRWVQRTPAMAAGITDHCWNVKELLLFRVPLPAWKPPKHRGRRSATEIALMERWSS
jgi:transposase-like protein